MRASCCEDAATYLHYEDHGWVLMTVAKVQYCPFCGTKLSRREADESSPVRIDISIRCEQGRYEHMSRKDNAMSAVAQILRTAHSENIQVIKDSTTPGMERRLSLLTYPEALERAQVRKA